MSWMRKGVEWQVDWLERLAARGKAYLAAAEAASAEQPVKARRSARKTPVDAH